MGRELDPQSVGDHLDRLYRAAWALCGAREDAEDLVQETHARVLARLRVRRASARDRFLELDPSSRAGRAAAGRRPLGMLARSHRGKPQRRCVVVPDSRGWGDADTQSDVPVGFIPRRHAH